MLLSEFVTGLLDDKVKGMLEYIRVVKPGGTLAFNEATWIKSPPPPDLVSFITQVFGVRSELLPPQGWIDLFSSAGVKDLFHTIHQAQAMSNPWEDLKDVIQVFPKMVSMILKNPLFRKFIRTSLAIPKDITEYFGYGLYVGKVYA
jgi:ubiquinone/menaquinone biosynthesis C-methylase UbiE